MSARRAVLLVGSARPSGTANSEALGRYLLGRLAEGGMATEVFHVSHCQRAEKERLLHEAVDEADLFVLSTPLYVDALPYLVTRFAERTAAHRAAEAQAAKSSVRFLALVNCGLPESEQTRTALDICCTFSREAGFEWVGGLGLGEGEAIHGRPLEELGGHTRNLRRGLDLTAEALLAGRAVPEEAQTLLGRPAVPSRLYTALASLGWLRTARRHGALRRLGDRPLR